MLIANFLTHKHKKVSVFSQLAKAWLASLALYVFLIVLFSSLPHFFQKQGLFSQVLNLETTVQEKAHSTAEMMTERTLALNFLGNLRTLTPAEANAFHFSGLLHLLAISGSQVAPLANCAASVCGFLVFCCFRRRVLPHQLMLVINGVKNGVALVVSLLVCGMFGCTGALARVFAFGYLAHAKSINVQSSLFYRIFPTVSPAAWNRFIMLVFIAFLFGNPFVNFSFILSALGAGCAEISLVITSLFFQNSIFFRPLGTLLLTSFFMGIALLPFSSASLLDSCLANLLAIPLVGFFIAPLSLLVLLLPKHFFCFDFFVNLLDASLSLFKRIAFTFYTQTEGLQPKNGKMFTLLGLAYLVTALVLLWSACDVWKKRKLFTARRNFLCEQPPKHET